MTKDELKAKLDAHAKWLRDEGGERANLRGANLREANLIGANLRGADLTRANLRGADLRGADLIGANLIGANLLGANLLGANLLGANLRGANLREANLRGANLRGADLRGAKDIPALIAAQLMSCPAVGAYTAFKKCREGVVELLIPADALRSSATSRKCRASKAIVVKLPDGCTEAHSGYDMSFCYRVGETVTASNWEDDRWVEGGGGIHHFITREEAEAYE